MEIEINDPELAKAVARKVGHPAPFEAEELEKVTTVTATNVRDPGGLAHLAGLKYLTLIGCEFPALEPLRGHAKLVNVEVEYSSLSDLSALASCPALTGAKLTCNSVEDASPLLEVKGLAELDLVGNPLDEKSWREVRPKLQERVEGARFSGDTAWELTRQLREKGLRACYYQDGETYRLCAPGLELTEAPEAGHPAITPDQLRRELEKTDLTLEQLFAAYDVNGPVGAGGGDAEAPAEAEFDWAAHEMVGDAAEAREWVRAAKGVSKGDREVLLRFIDAFPGQHFYRVDDAWLDQAEVEDGVKFPAWFRKVRKTLSYIKMPGIPFKLCFDHVAGEEVSGDEACYWANVRGPTAEEKEGVVARGRLYPLGDGGPGHQYTLAFRLDDDDRAVYRYRSEDGGRSDFSGETEVFPSYVEMFGHVVALLLPDGTRIEAERDGG
ncbi:MAG TPA: hypothetical protein VFS20_08770 [Longimicrobium sp.]|nr:hypothetical protein [Longimicrobium sp.]